MLIWSVSFCKLIKQAQMRLWAVRYFISYLNYDQNLTKTEVFTLKFPLEILPNYLYKIHDLFFRKSTP